MRVLHLIKTTAGAAWAVKLLREQVELGVEVHVILPDESGNTELYKKNGCNVHILNAELSVTRPWVNLKRIINLRAIIKKINPDIVHSHFVSTTLLMRSAMLGMMIPRIFQVPGPLHLEHFLFRNIDLLSAGKYDHWIGTCKWTVDKYQSLGVDAKKVHLSYYGTDINYFFSEKPIPLKCQLGLSNDTKVIAMVAYMYPPKRYLGQKRGLKGHEDLIDAISFVKRTNPNVHLVFIGGDWNCAISYRNSVESYGREKLDDSVTFLGNRKDVLDLYPNIDIAVFPSHSENVGGAVESLLMGVPTITSDVGGFPDLVISGETGLTVKPKAPKDLSAAIIKYLENIALAEEHAQKGKKLATELFNVKNTAFETLKIYNMIINKGNTNV